MFKRKRALIFLVFISFTAFILIFPLSAQAQNQVALPTEMNINLSAYSFDPIKKIPEIPQRLRIEAPQEDLAYRIIQFKRPLTRKQTEQLKYEFGLKLDQYIPNLAYLEKLTQSQVDNLNKFYFF